MSDPDAAARAAKSVAALAKSKRRGRLKPTAKIVVKVEKITPIKTSARGATTKYSGGVLAKPKSRTVREPVFRKRTETTTMPADRYTEEVLVGIRENLMGRIRRLSAAGMLLPPAQDLVELMGAVLPDTPEELDPHFADLGPFYGTDGVRRLLGDITKQAVESRRRARTILALQTGDGSWLYPAWQFTGQGAIHASLSPVLRALRGMDPWQAGVWLVSPHPDLDGASPREALRNIAPPQRIVALAVHDQQQALL